MSDLIYDWNTVDGPPPSREFPIEFDDETLRDGLQSPSISNPAIDQKLRILHLIERLGIESADIGLPGAGPHVVEHTTRLAREIVDSRLSVRPNCAARTVIADVRPIVDISRSVGIPIEACTFIGSSPVRQYTEDWSIEMMLRSTEEAVGFAVKEGIPVMYVTEDTVRANPDTLRQLFTAAIRAGATRLCLCDTVGHATPSGARALVRWTRRLVEELGADVKIDWHGHEDRGLSVVNTIAAVEAGADRVHGTALGVGERVGNTPMDTLLVNLQLLGYIDRDLSALVEYCEAVSEATGIPIPANYPVVGRDAFRTGTGVHAAAVIKAFRRGDAGLANLVYSGVPAHLFGREQTIEVGPMSGKSNVIYWLEKRGLDATDELVERIFQAAKNANTILADSEIFELVHQVQPT
ncbi:MAG: 2-isopropylmalate synthase [Acidobacteria bacterium]|nr:2-isopropylmalate synthase [Acidobacteriota bacterium]